MREESNYYFIGNIEGRDLFNDMADVIVCDGFTGNVILKLAESFYELTVRKGFQDSFFDRFNYEQYGGSPILGVNASVRSEEHTSELQSLMRISYAVFCLKKKNKYKKTKV